MGGRSGRVVPLAAAVAIGVLSAGLTPSTGGADTVAGARAQAASLRQAEQSALLQLYAAESALSRARNESALLDARSSALAAREADARRRAAIVTRSLSASQERVGRLLRYLYLRGEPDPVAIILGAESLDAAIEGVDGLKRATSQNERLVRQALAQADRLQRVRAVLASRRRDLDGARAAARTAETALLSAVAERGSTVSEISRRGAVTTRRLIVLEQQARAAVDRSARLSAQPRKAVKAVEASRTTTLPVTESAPSPGVATSAPVPPAAAAPGGTRTLVVDAVAYHLSGRTASGLPVGIGVIAVDPAVIPLGTRVFVPGYGHAVAADVGSAVKGLIIDLWMPTTAQARAWGRRTVTITVYG